MQRKWRGRSTVTSSESSPSFVSSILCTYLLQFFYCCCLFIYIYNFNLSYIFTNYYVLCVTARCISGNIEQLGRKFLFLPSGPNYLFIYLSVCCTTNTATYGMVRLFHILHMFLIKCTFNHLAEVFH